jgi:hypothetical protein
MKKLVACLVVALVWMWAGGASEALAVAKRAPATGAPQAYAVIRVGDEVKVISKANVGQEKKNASTKFKNDMKAYTDAKKAAAKSPDHGADLKKPAKAVVTVIKASVKSQEDAEKFRDKYVEEHEGLRAQTMTPGRVR